MTDWFSQAGKPSDPLQSKKLPKTLPAPVEPDFFRFKQQDAGGSLHTWK
jgi:hypothetical protein